MLPGESALAFYTATNKSDDDIIGVATYSVTPGQVAPYFSKIQCFCFEEQRLNAGETVDMPVFFYIVSKALARWNRATSTGHGDQALDVRDHCTSRHRLEYRRLDDCSVAMFA